MLIHQISVAGCFEIINDQLIILAEERRTRGGCDHGSLSIDLHLTSGAAVSSGRSEPSELTGERTMDLEYAVPALNHVDAIHDTIMIDNEAKTKLTNDAEPKMANDAEQKLASPTEAVSATARSLTTNSLSPFISITTHLGRASLRPSAHFPTSRLHSTQYLSIVACGPAALCDGVRAGAIQTISEGSWKRVEFIEECYSW